MINKAKYRAKIKDIEDTLCLGIMLTFMIAGSPLILLFFVVGLLAKLLQRLYLGSIEWWLKD